MAGCVDRYVLWKEQCADTGHASRYNGCDGTRGVDLANAAILVVTAVSVSGPGDGNAGWNFKGSRSSRPAAPAIADRTCSRDCVDYSGRVYLSNLGVAVISDVNIPGTAHRNAFRLIDLRQGGRTTIPEVSSKSRPSNGVYGA